VTNYLRLLRLPEDLQELLQAGRLSTGHARAILGSDQVDIQRRLARKVIEQDLSVRATERLVRQLTEPSTKAKRSTAKVDESDPNVRAAENKLRRQFGTQVRIVMAQGQQPGSIVLVFYNSRDLDRLYSLLTQ
jgi:ParB family chromosome partitioning protein